MQSLPTQAVYSKEGFIRTLLVIQLIQAILRHAVSLGYLRNLWLRASLTNSRPTLYVYNVVQMCRWFPKVPTKEPPESHVAQ